MARQSTAERFWLARHAAGERELERVLTRYFDDQTKRLLKALRDFDQLTPSVIPLAFDEQAEHELFIAAISDPIVAMMAQSAIDQLERRQRPKSTKGLFSTLRDFILPRAVKDAIAAAFRELIVQPFWRAIQATTKESVIDIVQDGIEDGASSPRLAKRLRDALGETQRVRAKAIARTETTLAYNSGHQATMDVIMGKPIPPAPAEIEDDGTISVREDEPAGGEADELLDDDDEIAFGGKRWLAILDGEERESHHNLHNIIVPGDANFNVGGSEAPYPGHFSLPPAQRVNCRCTIISVFTGLDD